MPYPPARPARRQEPPPATASNAAAPRSERALLIGCAAFVRLPPPITGSRLQDGVEVNHRIATQLLQPVERIDDTDGAALGAHHDRLGVGPAAPVAHPAQKFAGGYAGCREE